MFNKSSVLLAVILAAFCGVANSESRFNLPLSKSWIEQCEKEALALHPGRIANQQEFRKDGGFELRFEINGKDLTDWVVFCDGVSGKIVRHYALSDDKP